MKNNHPFNYRHYVEILTSAAHAGYEFLTFCKEKTDERKCIYIRHDIDNDVSIALRMARIESEMGVRATFLVMLRSANYNAAEGRNIKMLHEMAAMGHDLGLHFSLVDHPEYRQTHDLVELIQRDAELLGSLLGQPIAVFGFHNPTEGGQYKIEVPGLINTYNAKFFEEAHYLSESNMTWRNGCPCEIFATGLHDKVQMLIHPLSFAEELSSDQDVLMYFLNHKVADLLEYNVSQNRVLREHGDHMAAFRQYLQGKKSAE